SFSASSLKRNSGTFCGIESLPVKNERLFVAAALGGCQSCRLLEARSHSSFDARKRGRMPQTIPVIDMWAPIVPAREIMAYVADHFPEPQLGYLRVFWKGEASLEAFRRAAQAMACDDAQVLAMLDAADISRALITGFNEASTGGTAFVTNESVAAIA